MSTQNALGELMRMVNQTSSVSSNQLSAVPNSMARKTHPDSKHQQFNLHLHQIQQKKQQQNGFKPMKPLERKTAAIKPQRTVEVPMMSTLPGVSNLLLNAQLAPMPNAQGTDPRLFFPAAFMSPAVTPKLNNTPTSAGFQMPQLFGAGLPAGGTQMSFPQMTPEQIIATNMGAWQMGQVDPTAMMQPALLNKLYNDYIAAMCQQQQQQYLQALMLQTAQNNAIKKLNESPKITPPSSTNLQMSIPVIINNNLDPLTNLQNMVHPQVLQQQKSSNSIVTVNEQRPQISLIRKEGPAPHSLNKSEEDEIVDVGTPEQSINQEEGAAGSTSPASAPPKISTSSFSIAEILHSVAEEFRQRALTPLSIPLALNQSSGDAPTSSRTSTDSSQQDSHSPSIRRADTSSANNKQRIAQRKKHVEFHRRIKGIAGRGKFSQCQLCGDIIENNSSKLNNHVYSHSKSLLFGCVKCDKTFLLRADLHSHSLKAHPSNSSADHDQYHDLRDMEKLCDLLEKCFPRNSKLVIDTFLQKLLKYCKGSDALRCRLCEKDVPPNVNSLKNHLYQHPRYRCKMCHFTNENECEQLKHGQERHGIASPIYNVTSASVVLSGILTTCFGDYLPSEQKEFCEDTASMVSLDSPQSPQQSNIKAA